MNPATYFFVILLLIFLSSPATAQETVFAYQPSSVAASPTAPAPAYVAATFPGGEAALLRTVSEKLEYPELAREYGVEGTVVVKLELDRKGKITERSVVKGIGFGCDKAALAAMEKLPRWEPARRAGRRTHSFVYLPLRFRLQ